VNGTEKSLKNKPVLPCEVCGKEVHDHWQFYSYRCHWECIKRREKISDEEKERDKIDISLLEDK